jgi:hypothetical protein
MANLPAYAATMRQVDIAQVSTANTARDGTGTIATLLTGASLGTRVSSITIHATGTTTAGVIRLWLSRDSGSTWRLFEEVLVGALTPSTTVAAFRVRRTYDDLVMTTTADRIGASTHVAETFNVFAHAADF